jgi:glycosyltransferase 2 family protein
MAVILSALARTLKARWRLILGVVVSAVFVWIAVRGLDFGKFLAELQHANYIWLVPGVAIYFVGVWARTWRWHYMLRHIKSVPLHPLFKIVCIGYLGNNIFPVRAGEVLRSVVLKQEEDIPVSSSLATVLIERLFDGLTMLLFVFVALPFVPLESTTLATYRPFIVGFTVLFLGALVVFLALAARPQLARQLYGTFVQMAVPHQFRARVLAVADRFMVGFESLASGRAVVMIFVTSIAVWLCETGKYWFVMHAFPFEVSFLTLMLMNGVVNLATTLPAAPGYAGTFDAPGIAVLVAAGVPQEVAAAYTVVLHVALWLPITLLGAYYLWRSQVNVRQARREVALAQAAEAAAASDAVAGAG